MSPNQILRSICVSVLWSVRRLLPAHVPAYWQMPVTLGTPTPAETVLMLQILTVLLFSS